MSKSIGVKYAILLLATAVLAIFSTPLTEYLLSKYYKGENDWIGFAGNIVGGVLGGAFTLFGVGYAFSLERQKTFREGIPHKIMIMQLLKHEISSHRFSRNHSISAADQEPIANIKIFFNELKSFSLKSEDLLEKASQVDTDVFVAVNHYYKSIEIIEKKTNKFLSNIHNESRDAISTEIKEATKFHLSILEIVKNLLEKRKDEYIKDLYKQKNPKAIIKKFNDHEYLNNVLPKKNQ